MKKKEFKIKKHQKEEVQDLFFYFLNPQSNNHQLPNRKKMNIKRNQNKLIYDQLDLDARELINIDDDERDPQLMT